MKYVILFSILMFASLAQASSVCDLKANDQAVQDLNDIFDNGEMRGKDHVIGLKVLYEERMLLIEDCVAKNQIAGITKQELIDTLDNIDYNLKVYVEEMNEAIRISIENDRIGMATQMTLERDEEVLKKKTLMAKIKILIKRS